MVHVKGAEICTDSCHILLKSKNFFTEYRRKFWGENKGKSFFLNFMFIFMFSKNF